MPSATASATQTIQWKDRTLTIIDQTLLPTRCEYRKLGSAEDVWEAIKVLRVRGAPAIGVAAAFGILVGLAQSPAADIDALRARVFQVADSLATSRPTAVNLFWALDRMRNCASALEDGATLEAAFAILEEEAITIFEEDRAMCRAIGEHGAPLIAPNSGVLTHCNAGGLATAEYGTALAPMYTAHENGVPFHVYADETRPLLQGARLTAWELQRAGIDVTLICDNMAAQVMKEGRINLVVVGADRIAANGDAANKIGTYGVALLAQAHQIPFYVAAPSSTFDRSLPAGDAIPIEERGTEEVTHGFGTQTAPEGIKVYNPAFDVTPARLIQGIITEKGILRPPFTDSITMLFT